MAVRVGQNVIAILFGACLFPGCGQQTEPVRESPPPRQATTPSASPPMSTAAAALVVETGKLVREAHYGEALELLDRAAENPESRFVALVTAGELLMKLGRGVEAVPRLRAAAQTTPSRPEPHRWLAVWYYDIGAMDDALEHLETLAELVPRDGKPWRLRGLILKDFERFVEAIEAYQAALARTLPEQVVEEVRLELAECYVVTKQPELAAQLLEEVSDSPQKLVLLSQVELAMGNFDAAYALVDQLLAETPDHVAGLRLQASLYREDGQTERAIDTLERAIQLAPLDFKLRFDLMTAYNSVGASDRAAAEQEQMDRLRELRLEFTQLHHLAIQQPESADIRYQLGLIANQLGKPQLARNWFAAAVSLDPSHAEAISQLSELEQ